MGIRGAKNSKGAIGGHENIIFWNLLKIFLSCRWRAKKENVLAVFNGSLETYTRYSRVADEEQKKGS